MAPIIIAAIFTMMSIYAETPDCPVDASRKLMAHYMPWYVSRPFSGKWGWHWTMDHYNPEEIRQDGKREIASHYYPLIGPYDSGDPDALECQVLLMKFAGIDGIIIDWYGATTAPDQWRAYLDDFYVKNSDEAACVGTVFPQFHDVYEGAGVGVSHGFLDAREGRTFEDTLDLALRSNCRVIQHYKKQKNGTSFPYSATDLRIPVELYQLKKKHQSNQSVMQDLSKCSKHLFSGNLTAAKSLMKPK